MINEQDRLDTPVRRSEGRLQGKYLPREIGINYRVLAYFAIYRASQYETPGAVNCKNRFSLLKYKLWLSTPPGPPPLSTLHDGHHFLVGYTTISIIIQNLVK